MFPLFKKYIPDEWHKKTKGIRSFFYGILATLQPGYVTSLIHDCRQQREANRQATNKEEPDLDITPAWARRMLSANFCSCKTYPDYDFIIYFP
jgi:hypothetical protein